MPRFKVNFVRTYYATGSAIVIAVDEEDAKHIAYELNDEGDIEFGSINLTDDDELSVSAM